MLFYILPGAALLLFLLYLFLIGSRALSDRDFPAQHFAHRGLHNGVLPENSLPAFAAAVQAGYGIELDVRLTRDGQAVVFHDATLLRLCGDPRRVGDLTYAELSTLTLEDSDEHIPLFSDVLALVASRVPLIVELKLDRVNDCAVCNTAWQLLRDYPGFFCVESFSPFALRWFKKHHRGVLRGQLSGNLAEDTKGLVRLGRILAGHLLTNVLSRPHFIAYDCTAKRPLSYLLCHKWFGSLRVAWTVRSPLQAKEALSCADRIIFEGFVPDTTP